VRLPPPIDGDPAAAGAVRAAENAPVSVPISWDELDDPDLRPDRWTIRSVPERLATHGDPFRPLLAAAQELQDLT